MKLLICLHNQQVMAATADGQTVSQLPIHGETTWIPVREPRALKTAMSDLEQRTGSNALTEGWLIYDQSSARLLHSFEQWRGESQRLWQWLRWELLGWAEAPTAAQTKSLLSGLMESQGVPVSKAANPLANDIETLQATCNELRQQNLHLKSQLQERAVLDGEVLLSYLPALYHHAFSALSGTDLANLIGRVEPFDIPSPYQELSGEALRKKQRMFLSLSQAQQRTVLILANAVPQRLRVRSEMADTIAKLEQGV